MGGNNSKEENSQHQHTHTSSVKKSIDQKKENSQKTTSGHTKHHEKQSEVIKRYNLEDDQSDVFKSNAIPEQSRKPEFASHQGEARKSEAIHEPVKGSSVLHQPSKNEQKTALEREMTTQISDINFEAMAQSMVNKAEKRIEKKIEQKYVTKIQYLELMENFKMLSETVRDLNTRISELEKQENVKPLREVQIESLLNPLNKAEERPESTEDLISRMKEQLKKRKPDVSVLEEHRRKYKELRLAHQTQGKTSAEN